MAKGALGWTNTELAVETKLHKNTLNRAERHGGALSTMELIQRTFEANGIIFLPATETEGPGVRFATPGEAIQSRAL